MVPRQFDTHVYYLFKNRILLLEHNSHQYPTMTVVPVASALPLYGLPRLQRCPNGSSQGIREELVPQVILVPYDPSCIECEAGPAENIMPPACVKQEVIHSDISEPENCMTNVPVISGANVFMPEDQVFSGQEAKGIIQNLRNREQGE